MELDDGIPSLLELAIDGVCDALFAGRANFYNAYIHEALGAALLKRLKSRGQLDDRALAAFAYRENCHLTQANLEGCPNVTDLGLSALVDHELIELEVSNCKRITGKPLKHSACQATLQTLVASGCSLFSPPDLHCFPHLTTLNLSRTRVDDNCIRSIARLTCLTSLSLAYCSAVENHHVSMLVVSPVAGTLRHLSLAGTSITNQLASSLFCFNHLETLDLSSCVGNLSGNYLISSLSELESLHSLNLCKTNVCAKDIEDLVNRGKIRFLGLCQTRVDLAELPALYEILRAPFRGPLDPDNQTRTKHIQIAAYFNPACLAVALQVYGQDKEIAHNALKGLFQHYCSRPPTYDYGMAELLLKVMAHHMAEVKIQLGASASLYLLTQQGVRGQQHSTRVETIRMLTTVMMAHINHLELQRNACLTLCNFHIQHELEAWYSTVISALLESALRHHDPQIQHTALSLSNGLVGLGVEQKEAMGQSGVIGTILQIIAFKVANKEMDNDLETAWCALWNITDETAQNCELFLAAGGMEIFMQIMHLNPQQGGLVRNMLGLIGNIAEVRRLRCHLMRDDLLQCLSSLLESEQDGIEVSYNCSGVVANLASEGPAFWEQHTTMSRAAVLQRMADAVQRWDVRTPRSINYRSLRPIVGLALCRYSLEVQFWAAWALANLCTMYPEKYCELLAQEHHLSSLQSLVESEAPFVQQMARLAQESCSRWHNHSSRSHF